METASERFHAHSHLSLVAGLDPGNHVVDGEIVVAFEASNGVVLWGHDDGGDWEVSQKVGWVVDISADSWHGESLRVELSLEGDLSCDWYEWWKSGLNQQPVENDVLVKTVEVLEFTSTETNECGSVAGGDLSPGSHGIDERSGLAVSNRYLDVGSEWNLFSDVDAAATGTSVPVGQTAGSSDEWWFHALASRQLVGKPVDSGDGVVVVVVTSSDKSACFESIVSQTLSPYSGSFMVSIDKDGGLLPGGSKLNMHWESSEEFVDWECNILAVDGARNLLQLGHSRDNIDTASEAHPVDGDISCANTIVLIFGVPGTDGGTSGGGG